MQNFGRAVVKFRVPIVIVCVLLLIPSVLGMLNTRINYDMLDYLPSGMETVKGQNILLDQFGKGAFSLIIVEGMEPKDVSGLKKQIEKVEHVDKVIWYDDIADISVPMDILPGKLHDAFNSGNATLMAVFFNTSTSEDATIKAIQNIRAITGKQCFVSGMSAMVTDLKELCEKEEPIYVMIAVALACIVMMLLLDSWLVPVIFLVSIGMAILYNFGTNFFLGEISYITKALCAVLQLAVTLDFSIFLWNSYKEEKARCDDHREAMARAIGHIMRSIVGSSLTEIAAFLSLCFMSYMLGLNLGIVMAKGVLLGVAASLTLLPAMILLFDKPLEKTMHKPLIPRLDKLGGFVARRFWIFLIVFAVLVFPALYGYMHTDKYYELSKGLPKDLDYAVANSKLSRDFGISTTHMALVSSALPQKDMQEMIKKMDKVDGVKYTLGLNSVLGPDVPEEILPDSIKSDLENDQYRLLLINTKYNVASDEVNSQITKLSEILKSYDKGAMLIGEASCTKDMINMTDRDFKVVEIISIAAIFLIIAIVLKSVTLPVILVAVIEFSIFINLGIPYYTNLSLPFISPTCISTIQLGVTVDYAILLTNRYLRERSLGLNKYEAAKTAFTTSVPAIVASAFGLFAATFGVSVYSKIDMISSMCGLMARGAVISTFAVIFILPAMFILLDKAICKTTWLYGIHKSSSTLPANLEGMK
jgi:predicted RND superfamily exporter protein